MNAMRFLFKVLVVLILMIVLAALLMPVNPRPSKKQLQRIRCQFEIMDLAVGFEKYKTTYQVYPSGNKLLVWKQLSGDNPQKIIFAPIKAGSINTNGDFLDPWGTPYAMNFSSTNNFVISSAGKDKIFGDADDIIFNSVSNDFVKL
jgi:type II secretory pathway pseudopilin PulG